MIEMVMEGKNLMLVEMHGVLTKEDYEDFRPVMESKFVEGEKMRFLFDLSRVDKFTAGAVWEDIKADLANVRFVGTTAIVSQKRFFAVMSKVVNAVFPEKIRHFENRSDALNWVRAN